MNKDTIIVDLDGTLALDEHRSHHLKVEPKRWKEYFSACGNDEPNHPVIFVVKAMRDAGFHIVIVSGRCDSTRKETTEWLRRHEIPYSALHMRAEGDRTQDDVLKIDIIKRFGLTQRIFFVLEDRSRVVAAWRAAGFACFQVAPGDF